MFDVLYDSSLFDTCQILKAIPFENLSENSSTVEAKPLYCFTTSVCLWSLQDNKKSDASIYIQIKSVHNENKETVYYSTDNKW